MYYVDMNELDYLKTFTRIGKAKLKMTITNRQFHPNMADQHSSEFTTLADEFTEEVSCLCILSHKYS